MPVNYQRHGRTTLRVHQEHHELAGTLCRAMVRASAFGVCHASGSQVEGTHDLQTGARQELRRLRRRLFTICLDGHELHVLVHIPSSSLIIRHTSLET